MKEPNELKELSENLNYCDSSDSDILKPNEHPNEEGNWTKNYKEEGKSQMNSCKQTNLNSSNTISKSPLINGYSFNIRSKSQQDDNLINDDNHMLLKSFNLIGDSENNINKKKTEDILKMLMNQYNNSIQTNISSLFSSISINKDIINANREIVIKEIEGKQLTNGFLKINAGGLVKGARNKIDGVALFGWSIENSAGQIVNDFAFTSTSDTYSLEPTLFLIYFKQQKKRYYIRCYYESLSSYMSNYALSPFMIKLTDLYPLQNIEFLMIGDLFFVVTVDKELGLLKITKKKNKKYKYSLQETFSIEYDRLITIGRDTQCTIPFADNRSLSKIHCSFYYNKKDKVWFLQDGAENKPSTNGVWMVPKKSFKIYDGMLFKILGCTKCQINFL